MIIFTISFLVFTGYDERCRLLPIFFGICMDLVYAMFQVDSVPSKIMVLRNYLHAI